MKNNFNQNLYATSLFNEWANKEDFDFTEKYFLNKYITDTSKHVIEAGTGGGRIIFYLEKQGFNNLEAFDYVPEMIAYCKTKKDHIKSKIKFKVANAVYLTKYHDNTFDYLIYMQQVLCFVNKENFLKSLHEAHRIGHAKSIYIFSFLNWDSKVYNPVLSLVVNFFRLIRGEKVAKYYLPWLKLNGKFNLELLNGNQPKNLWVKRKTLVNIIENTGFKIIEMKTEGELLRKRKKNKGKIYIACKKI